MTGIASEASAVFNRPLIWSLINCLSAWRVNRAKLIAHGLNYAALVHLRGEELHKLLGGVLYLLGHDPSDLVRVLQLAGRRQDIIKIKGRLSKLLQFFDRLFFDIQYIELKERLGIHFIRRFKVGKEPVRDPIREHTKAPW